MKLYLVQHGEAVTKEVDSDRPLTEKGLADSVKTAKCLKNSRENVNVIWYSTKTRARETAGLFARELLPGEGAKVKRGLDPNDPVKDVFTDIECAGINIMLVGHLPFLQKLLSLVMTGSEDKELAKFSTGGIICLEKEDEGKWQIDFIISPELL